MTGEHGIRAAGQGDVACDDLSAHRLIDVGLAQFLELVVKVEHQRGALEAARGTARLGVEADNEKGLAAEAQREVRIIGAVTDAWIWRLPCHELPMDENSAMQITPMMTAMLSWRWKVSCRRKPESRRSMNKGWV